MMCAIKGCGQQGHWLVCKTGSLDTLIVCSDCRDEMIALYGYVYLGERTTE